MSNQGGKRPGAGAPRGNINAVKTGVHSKQMKELAEKVGGFMILDKKRKKLVWVYSEEDLQKLKKGGLGI